MLEEWKKDCEGKGLFLHTLEPRLQKMVQLEQFQVILYPKLFNLALTCKTEKVKN